MDLIGGAFDENGIKIKQTSSSSNVDNKNLDENSIPIPIKREYWAGRGLAVQHGKIKRGSAGVGLAFEEFCRGSIRGGLVGFGFKGGLSLLFSLLKKSTMKQAIAGATNADTFRFAGFVATFSGLFRFTNALMATARGKDDQWNSFVAGGVAGLSLVLDTKDRRKTIALYLLVRAIDLLVRRLVRKGRIPFWRHSEAVLFGISNMPIMYGFLFMPEILQRGYYQWILNMGNVTHKGLGITLRERRDKWFYEHKKIPFQSCGPHYHEGPCLTYTAKDWVFGLGRAFKIYLPVHFLPLLLFRHEKLLKDPKTHAGRTVKALISSCMFLTTYQTIVKFTNCVLRNGRQEDAGWHALLAGFLTSLSCGFESKSRISELMLYCMPRAIDATWNYLRLQNLVTPVAGWDVVAFSFTSAILLSSASADFKSAYYKALCSVIGNNKGAFPQTPKPKRP